MSKIKIERSHNLSLDDAIKKANRIGEELEQEYGLNAHWKTKNVAIVTGKGVNGTMTISRDKVVVEMKLGFALRLFSKQIKSGVSKRLEETLKS